MYRHRSDDSLYISLKEGVDGMFFGRQRLGGEVLVSRFQVIDHRSSQCDRSQL